jgi:hypothetical protein
MPTKVGTSASASQFSPYVRQALLLEHATDPQKEGRSAILDLNFGSVTEHAADIPA